MKYTIIHVNDRAQNNIDYNKKILENFQYVNDIEFFNGNLGNSWDVINHMGIRQDVWNPYDGRSTPPLPGELGIWISTINCWQYIVDNDIDLMLVLEDDILLAEDFVKKLQLAISDLPNDFDFLSLYYFKEQNWEDDNTEIGSEYIKKSFNQYSAGQAILYSKNGAKNLLKILKRVGIEYTTDCFIFHYGQNNALKGYSIKKENDYFVSHEYKNIKSLIDPDNTRNTNDL